MYTLPFPAMILLLVRLRYRIRNEKFSQNIKLSAHNLVNNLIFDVQSWDSPKCNFTVVKKKFHRSLSFLYQNIFLFCWFVDLMENRSGWRASLPTPSWQSSWHTHSADLNLNHFLLLFFIFYFFWSPLVRRHLSDHLLCSILQSSLHTYYTIHIAQPRRAK